MQQRSMFGGRYGIWGEPTEPMRMDSLVDPMHQAIGTANGIQSLFGNYYKNKLAGLDTGLKQNQLDYSNQTLQGAIGAANTKNQTDTQYYPLMQQAKLQQEEANVKEIMARTGLSYAQAKMALAHIPLLQAQTDKTRSEMDPLHTQNMIFNAYENAPQGSDRRNFYEGLLAKEVGKEGLGFLSNKAAPGSPEGTPAGTNASSGIGGIPLSSASVSGPQGGSQAQGFDVNPLGGGPRSTFHQAFINTPDNPDTTMESPTTSSASRNQNRAEAGAEMDYIGPIMKKGFDPYMGPLGSSKLMIDSSLASASPNTKAGKDAAQRLLNYSLANRFKREAANIISRQTSGQAPGVEAAREQEQSSFGHLPGNTANYFIPSSIASQSFGEYLPAQQKMADFARDQERQGYLTPGEAPAWSNAQTPAINRGFLGVPTGMSLPKSSSQGSPSRQTYNSPSSEDIAHTAKLYNISPAEVRRRLGMK